MNPRTEKDFEEMPMMDLFEEVIDLEHGDQWDGGSSKFNEAERKAARKVFETRLKQLTNEQ